MANRYFGEMKRLSFEKKVVDLFFKFAVGATGSPTLDVVNSKGIKSVVRNSAGKYTITLQDAYQKLLFCQPMVLLASGLPAVREVALASQAVSNAAAPTLVMQFSAAGVAAEVDNGAVVCGHITLGDSTAI